MRTIRRCCLWAAVISICCALMLVCSCASADESETVQVIIPVVATGADCCVELVDSNDHRVQWIDLEKDAPGAFTVTCDGLKRFTYRARIVNRDDELAEYDKTVYTIHVDVFRNVQGQASYIYSLENPANPGSKTRMISFCNIPQQLEPTPPPEPTPTPIPVITPPPTATPLPYKERFSFRKVWSSDYENSIDWVMYNGDGSVRSKKFNKTEISQTEWQYEAYFQEKVDDCYIVEYVPEGYMVTYVNVWPYEDVTDRCHNGGTIVNSKVPQTSDSLPIGLHLFCMLAAGAGLVLLLKPKRRRYIR